MKHARELEDLEEFIAILDNKDEEFPVLTIKTYQEVFGDNVNKKGPLGEGKISYRINSNGTANFVSVYNSDSDITNSLKYSDSHLKFKKSVPKTL